ncbi:hypothetical protein M6B38_146540 [Iris pallida]|uniref:Uncharacterized protein n=1 Tax=Iris pallida TaxID=29817 RepID=A0AAX6F918_IRIPA|nr:hypothetical protein M6B38_146540 [Iris pallida]
MEKSQMTCLETGLSFHKGNVAFMEIGIYRTYRQVDYADAIGVSRCLVLFPERKEFFFLMDTSNGKVTENVSGSGTNFPQAQCRFYGNWHFSDQQSSRLC